MSNIEKNILNIYLKQKRESDFERQYLIDSMKKITGGKGFIIVQPQKNERRNARS